MGLHKDTDRSDSHECLLAGNALACWQAAVGQYLTLKPLFVVRAIHPICRDKTNLKPIAIFQMVTYSIAESCRPLDQNS
jgi:hypothetical protein